MEVDELGGGGGRGSVEPAGSGRSSEGEEGVRCAVEAHVLPPGADPLLGALGAAAPPLCAESEGAGAVLKLLWFLHRLNEHWARLYSTAEVPEAQRGAPALPPAVFPNSKLNAKLMRQLQDPLALCSRSFPSWCATLVNAYPFLFSFATRRLFLHSTAFGLSRALQRLHAHAHEASSSSASSGAESRLESRLGRLPRQKVRISRSRLLDSAVRVMELYAAQPALLEVEYFGEVGTGLGPTLEFYALVSHDLRKAELDLWYHEEQPISDEPPAAAPDSTEAPLGGAAAERARDKHEKLVHAPCGLFPRPVAQEADGSGVPKRTIQLFTFIGRLCAKAMLDGRLVDLCFAPPFYRHLLCCELGLEDLHDLSPQLFRSLHQLQALASERSRLLRAGGKPAEVAAAVASLTLHGCPVDQLGLDFTLPGFPDFELKPGGADVDVTIDNLGEYVRLVTDALLVGGVRAQLAAFRQGFSDVFLVSRLAPFTPSELDVLLNGARERWDKATVIELLKFDHGYTRSSAAISHLLDVIADLTDAQLASFLKFVTGSPRLPVGGLARLSPRLTIVQKKPESGVSPDAYLPSVMTCANYLKLPDYSSKEVMRERILTAINEGQGAFLLS